MAIINLKDEISISNSDVQAIICALPLVEEAITVSPEQAAVNAICCNMAESKLINHDSALSPNEYRVIYLAIGTALDILEYRPLDYLGNFKISAEWRAELSKNYFAYQRLYPHFEMMVDHFHT